jgi:hypothetical protein
LRDAFAVAVFPPTSGQPVIQGLPTLQALVVGGGVAPAQVEQLAATLEGRGAVLGTADAGGLEVHTQLGTRASGYALAFGLEGDILYMGTSPQIIGQAHVASREGAGLASTEAFQIVSGELVNDPFLVLYIGGQPYLEQLLLHAFGAQSGAGVTEQPLTAFEAIGVALRLEPGSSDGDGPARVEGVAYFLMRE